jgi:hypothetical protein
MREKRGEHPFGDLGPLIIIFMFLVVWVGERIGVKKWGISACEAGWKKSNCILLK